jgi:enoyl-CoA hydratase/carnithine racemase
MATLVRERIDDAIEVLRLDRPERRNAMDSELIAELIAALRDAADDESLAVLVYSTTSKKALCAGADVTETLDDAGAVKRMELFAEMYALLEAVRVPTIAVCVGDCIGAGAELASSADLRVGGENLRMGWPGARLGVPVGPARLTPLVGLARAKDLILTGRLLDVDEAERIGLLHSRAPAAGAETAAIDLARAVAAHSHEGLRRLKSMFRDLEDSERRVAYENERLLEFERTGPGLPRTRP